MIDDVVVLGGGVQPFGQFPDLELKDLSRNAIWAAIRDSGIDPRRIQVGYVANCFHGFFTGQDDAVAPIAFRYAGLSGFPIMHVEGGGASGTVAVHEAVMAVASGEYDVAIAVGVEKLYVPGDPAKSIAAIATSGEKTIAVELGLTWIAELTMGAHRLMERHGWTAEDFALVAEKNRYHASLNPNAELQTPISVQEILAARTVAHPLTRPMCAGAAVDGAAAVILCNRKVAKKLGDGRPLPSFAAVSMLGAPHRSAAEMASLPGMLSMNESPQTFAAAYERAGIGPEDLELVQLHDAVAPEEMLGYQVIGLAKPGEEADLLRSGATRIGGRVPVNSDGGLIARGHPIAASGVAQIVETAAQMQGRAGDRQVLHDGRPPRVAGVHNAGAQGGPSGGVAVSAALLLVV